MIYDDLVKPKLDVVFKGIMTRSDNVLKSFLSAFLEVDKSSIKDFDFINTENLPVAEDSKLSRVDLKIDVDGKIINIEIQLCDEGNFPERTLYYWAAMFTEGLKSGSDFSQVKKTICMNILDFNLFDSPEPYSVFMLRENKRHELLTDKCTLMFMELPKIDKVIDKNDTKKLWMQFIKSETKEELDMLTQTGNPDIQEAVVILHKMSSDERVREEVRMRTKNMLDENNRIANALKKGKAEGRAEGRAEGIAEGKVEGRAEGRAEERALTVEKMRADGVPEEFIRKYYGGDV